MDLVGPEGFEPSPYGLKDRCAAVTPQPVCIWLGKGFKGWKNHGSFPLNEWLRVVDSGSLKDRT